MFNSKIFRIKIVSVLKMSLGNKTYHNTPRPYDTLAISTNGNSDYVHYEKIYHVEKSDIIFIPCNYEYDIRSESNNDMIVIHFVIENSPFNKIEVMRPRVPKVFNSIFENIYNTWYYKRTAYQYKAYSQFFQILENIELQSVVNGVPLSQNIQAAVDYIMLNFSDPSLDIKKLADIANISETYFRRIFKSAFNTTPVKYLTAIRMNHAAELLKSGYYTVEEVSGSCGYYDSKYFSKIYKKIYSKSPSQDLVKQPVIPKNDTDRFIQAIINRL